MSEEHEKLKARIERARAEFELQDEAMDDEDVVVWLARQLKDARALAYGTSGVWADAPASGAEDVAKDVADRGTDATRSEQGMARLLSDRARVASAVLDGRLDNLLFIVVGE